MPRRAHGCLALTVLAFATAVALGPFAIGLDLTREDGYYYLRIAQHLAAGNGSTFDGLHPTNGYHPLWLLVLVPLFRFCPDPAVALRGAHLVQGLFMAAAAVVLQSAARRLGGEKAANVAVLGWLGLSFRLWWCGLELALHTLCLALVLAAYLRCLAEKSPARSEPYLVLGLMSTLCFLARLDSLVVVALVQTALLIRLWRTEGSAAVRRCGFLAAGPVASVFLAYVGLNGWWFGHPWPVSAFIKRSWSAEILGSDPYLQRFGWLAAEAHDLLLPLLAGWNHPSLLPLVAGLVTAALLPLLWLALRRRSPATSAALTRLAPWAAAGLAQHLLYSLIFHGGARFSPWYYVVQPLTAALALGVLTEWTVSCALPGRWRPAAALLLVVAGLTLAGAGVLRFWRDERAVALEPLREAAEWARRYLPPTARIGAWNAGTLGFFSERQVVNLDGLVNSWDFTRRRHDLCRYWREEEITHVVDLFRGDRAIAPVPVYPSYAACAGRLELLWLMDRHDPEWSARVYRLR